MGDVLEKQTALHRGPGAQEVRCEERLRTLGVRCRDALTTAGGPGFWPGPWLLRAGRGCSTIGSKEKSTILW